MKTLLIATSLLVAGTSMTLARGAMATGEFGYGSEPGQVYTYSPGYHDPDFMRGDAAPGAPQNFSGTLSGQPSPSSGVEAERG
jgi:hypothetical protein